MRSRFALPLLCLAAVAMPALAQPAREPPAREQSRVPTVTRLVKTFYELERALRANARLADPAALERAVDPGFEMRIAGAPGTPVPRDDWINALRAAPKADVRVEQMAVHDLGGVAIVSFREVETAGSREAARTRFVVDCWKRDGDDWRLAIRYTSDASAPAAKPAAPKTLDKRY